MASPTLAHGEVYPSFMNALLENLGKNPKASSGENVNVSGMIGAIEGPWIGFGLYILCPQPIDAARFVPPILSHLKQEGFSQSASTFEAQLHEAIRVAQAGEWMFSKREMTPMFWPEGGGTPPRRGR